MKPFPGILQKSVIDHPFVTKTGKRGCQRCSTYVLTPEQDAWLREWFPKIENARLAKACGASPSTVHRFATQMGLVKSPEGMRGIKRRQAAHIKRMCERNGYYDSLRGKQVPEACRQAVARMWQDVRDGKRQHPLKTLKSKNPRKYRRCMVQRSESRKEVLRAERRRILYGLPIKTKLIRQLALKPYTRRQTAHRYNAMRRGYILADECYEGSGHRYTIYYDSQTQRAPIFEQNLVEDGFHLEPWTFD